MMHEECFMPLRDVFALPGTTKTLSICMDEAAFHGRGSKTLAVTVRPRNT